MSRHAVCVYMDALGKDRVMLSSAFDRDGTVAAAMKAVETSLTGLWQIELRVQCLRSADGCDLPAEYRFGEVVDAGEALSAVAVVVGASTVVEAAGVRSRALGVAQAFAHATGTVGMLPVGSEGETSQEPDFGGGSLGELPTPASLTAPPMLGAHPPSDDLVTKRPGTLTPGLRSPYDLLPAARAAYDEYSAVTAARGSHPDSLVPSHALESANGLHGQPTHSSTIANMGLEVTWAGVRDVEQAKRYLHAEHVLKAGAVDAKLLKLTAERLS